MNIYRRRILMTATIMLACLTVQGAQPAASASGTAEHGKVISYEDSAISFSIDGRRGHLLSFKNGREFVVADERQSLFSLQFRNTTGAPQRFYSNQATEFDAQRVDEPGLTR